MENDSRQQLRTNAFVQARMGSKRLPGKTLLHLAGKSVLQRCLNRLSRSRRIGKIVVLTTNQPEDDAIALFCKQANFDCFRGNVDDVLDRFYRASIDYPSDYVVRITADCPLIDPDVVDRTIEYFLAHPLLDYVSNAFPDRTFPRGLDTEVFTVNALIRAWQLDTNPIWREHVTPYIYNHPETFSISCYKNQEDWSNFRWTLDTQEDYELLKNIFLFFPDDSFSWKDVIQLLRNHRDWETINKDVEQKPLL
jgi:spore coat polysaccharide biosynthesis protein SpsF